MDWAALIRDIPDFPIEGVLFKDITPLLRDAAGFRAAIDALAEQLRGVPADLVVGMESRGFIFAAPLAYALGLGFAPVRRLGKLPAESIRIDYELEYGTNSFEMHRDAVMAGQRVLVVPHRATGTGGPPAPGRPPRHLAAASVAVTSPSQEHRTEGFAFSEIRHPCTAAGRRLATPCGPAAP